MIVTTNGKSRVLVAESYKCNTDIRIRRLMQKIRRGDNMVNVYLTNIYVLTDKEHFTWFSQTATSPML